MKQIYILASLAIAATSCSHKSESDASAITPVEVAEAVTDSVTLYSTYPGYTEADNTVNVVGRVNGQILTKTYDGGQYVSKGTVLFTIDPTTYRDALDQALAQLATAQSTYEYNKKHYEAIKKAFASDAVSQMDLVQAESDYHQSEASIKSAQAAVSTARQNLSYCTVTAPTSGHITSANADPGAYISGEASPFTLATIYKDDILNVTFSIDDEQYVQLLRDSVAVNEDLKHIPLKFSESLPHSYTADLSYMAPSLDPNTGTMKIQAKIKNTYGELKSGMYVTIDLPVASDPKAVLVKDASISTDQLGKYLYTVNDSDRVVYTPIQIGQMADDSMRIVTSGIAPGQRYVTKAMLKVRNDMKIKPVLTK